MILRAELTLEVRGKLDRFKDDMRRALKDVGKIDIGAQFRGGFATGIRTGVFGGEGGAPIGTMIGKLGLIFGVLQVISEGIKKTVHFLAKASPLLGGILGIFGQAFALFFRPFGDFLGMFLRPLAIILMRFALDFYKFMMKMFPTPAKMAGAGGAMVTGAVAGAIGGSIIPVIGTFIGAILGGIVGLLGAILVEKVPVILTHIRNFGQELWNRLINWAEDVKETISGFGDFLWGKLITVWNYTKDFGSFLWGNLQKIWNYGKDFGNWLWDRLVSIWKWGWNFGQWLWNSITGAIGDLGRWLSGLGSWLWNQITGAIGSIGRWFAGWQAGTPYVPKTGLYVLHKGEQVIGATQQGGRTATIYNTFNFSGARFEKTVDVEEAIKRANRDVELSLRQRGISI